MGFCSKGLKNKFETAMVNEPSVFEPLKFYCSAIFDQNAQVQAVQSSLLKAAIPFPHHRAQTVNKLQAI